MQHFLPAFLVTYFSLGASISLIFFVYHQGKFELNDVKLPLWANRIIGFIVFSILWPYILLKSKKS